MCVCVCVCVFVCVVCVCDIARVMYIILCDVGLIYVQAERHLYPSRSNVTHRRYVIWCSYMYFSSAQPPAFRCAYPSAILDAGILNAYVH